MTAQTEPVFGGVPAIPSADVFERARRENPPWYQALEQAYAQFTARPENAGVYADPKGSGATIQQMWMFLTLFGVRPYCSVTAQELERVVFAAFLFAPQWALVQGQDFALHCDAWRSGEFFQFFRLRQLAEQTEGALVQRVFAPGAFKEQIALRVGMRPQTGVIRQASLRIQPDWLVANLPLALDLVKRFIKCFAPPLDRATYEPIADAFGRLRNPAEMLKVKDADPGESDAVRCVQAFMGGPGANVISDFAHVSVGSGAQDGQPVQFIDVALL